MSAIDSLHKKVPNIKRSTIIGIIRVPEYAEAIKKYQGSIDEEVLYEIVKASYMDMFENNKGSYNAKRFLSCLSAEVKGDKQAWIRECGLELKERRTTRSGRILYDIVKGV